MWQKGNAMGGEIMELKIAGEYDEKLDRNVGTFEVDNAMITITYTPDEAGAEHAMLLAEHFEQQLSNLMDLSLATRWADE